MAFAFRSSLVFDRPLPLGIAAQTEYAGKLEAGLHVDLSGLSFAIFDPVSAEDAKLVGVTTGLADKVFAGELALPKDGALRYKAVIVRLAYGWARVAGH
jgi:hypothetical protein